MSKKIFMSVLYMAAIFLSSCSDDDYDPGFTGYYIVDGVKRSLGVSSIHPAYSQINHNGQNIYLNAVVLHGKNKETQSIEIRFVSDTQSLKNETYTFTDRVVIPYERNPLEMHYCYVRVGETYLDSMTGAEGTFEVLVSDGIYTFDLDVVIDGHKVKAHYEGQSHLDLPS